MGKAELVDAVMRRTSLPSRKLGQEAVEAVLDTITDELRDGGGVTLVGFGSFEVRQRAARTGRNPHTGAALQIAAKKSVGFKVSKKLVDSINE